MTDLRAYADQAADRAQIPRKLFERQIQQESGFDPNAFNADSGATGIAQIVPRFHPDVDPTDPIASLDYAATWMGRLWRQYGSYARALAAYNWGPGNVAGWDGQRDTLPAETRHYLDVILGPGWPEPTREPAMPTPTLRVTDAGVRLRSGPGTDSTVLATLPADTLVAPLSEHAWREVQAAGQRGWIAADLLAEVQEQHESAGGAGAPALVYNPDQPPERQRQDWSCSIRAATWVLKSLGIDVDAGQMQDEMVPWYVTPADGLLDGRGYGLAEVLRKYLPAEWHDRVHVVERISWDELASIAGQGPIALGLHGAYHWLNVARVLPDGDLDAPNPAPNYPATAPIGDLLTRQEMDRWGPASAVFVNVQGA